LLNKKKQKIKRLKVASVTKSKHKMDTLINSLQKFDIGEITTIDEIIDKLDNLSSYDSQDEWNILELTFARLCFLKSMEFKLKTSNELIKSLSHFMEQVDKINQRYLKTINWDGCDDELKDANFLIKEKLECSLNYNCPFEKINKVLEGYHILVDIVEDYANEKMNETVDNEFIEEFCGKRRRTK